MSEENLGIAQKFCRTCVKQLCQDDAFDIFLVPGLAKKLCVCTSLTVEQQDGFPTNICPSCYNRLNDLHDFQAQCLNAVQQFKEMLLACSSGYFSVVNAAADLEADVAFAESEHTHFDPLLNSKIEIEYDQDVFKMIEAVDKESVEDGNEREQANDSFDDEDSGGMEFEADSSDSDYTLPLSSLKGKGKDIKETKKAGSDSVEIESKPKTQRLLECHICTQKFKKTCIYQEHMKLHDDQLPHQCPVESCKIGFTTPNGLRHHIEHMHTELCQMLSCTVEGCNKQFPLKRSLTRHLRIIHNMAKPETHPCSECEKVFRCPMALKKHMYKHTGEELPFCCDICKRRFATSTELRHHLLRHAGIKNFICTYCGVRKTTKQELDNHILTHTREKNLKCDKCDYLTHCKQSLWKHTRVVHMKIKKHACSYCEKTFGNAYARRTHERLHTGESCFECTICSRMFLFEKTLTTHLKTHEKREKLEVEKKERKKKVKKESDTVKKLGARVERVDIARLAGTVVNPIPTVSVPPPNWEDVTHVDGQVICPECGKSFNRKEGMKLHYKVVHQKVKDYICRFCSKRFGRLQYLKAHENIHTGATPFKCNICDMAFKGDSALFVHKKRKHCPKIAKPAKVPKTPRAPKPKPPKPAIESQPTERCKRSKTKLNMHPKNQNHEQFEDPAAERAAAQAQLFAHQENKNEIKLKAAEETQKIQTAAQEQLEILKRLSEKMDLDSLPSVKN